MNTESRKQLLLTRIALERAELTRELDELQRVASPQRLLPAAMRAAFGPAWLAGLFGLFGRSATRAGTVGESGWFGRLVRGWLLLRRHPVLWPMLAGALPWVRRRGRAGRLMVWLPVGAGIAAAMWTVLAKRRPAAARTD